MPSSSTQAHDIGDDIRGRVNLGDFIILNGAGFQGATTDRGLLEPHDSEWASLSP